MPPLSLMIKPASSLCNLSCEYCFYKDVSEHREHLGFGVMEKETAEILIGLFLYQTAVLFDDIGAEMGGGFRRFQPLNLRADLAG